MPSPYGALICCELIPRFTLLCVLIYFYGLVLRREDGHLLRRVLEFEVEGRRKKGRLERTWKKRVMEGVNVGWSGEGAVCRSQ